MKVLFLIIIILILLILFLTFTNNYLNLRPDHDYGGEIMKIESINYWLQKYSS